MKLIYSLHDHRDKYDNNNKDLDPDLLFSDEERKIKKIKNISLCYFKYLIKTIAQITVPFSNYFKIRTSSSDE